MKIEISPQPVFNLTLTHDQVWVLVLLCRHHYDSVCSQAAVKDGFVWGWYNATRPIADHELPPQQACRASARQLDTLLKICEGARMLHQAQLITIEQHKWINDELCPLVWSALAASATVEPQVLTLTEPTPEGHRRWLTNPGRW